MDSTVEKALDGGAMGRPSIDAVWVAPAQGEGRAEGCGPRGGDALDASSRELDALRPGSLTCLLLLF